MQRGRRYWSVVAVTAAVVAVVVAVARLAPKQPNYSRLEEGFYLGARVSTPPPGTRAVLNLCEMEDSYRAEVQRWQPIPDAGPAPGLAWLRHQVEFLDRQRRAGLPVFVHCKAGVSRAGLVTVAYLMWRNGWSRDRALQFVQSRRPRVRPNPAFMARLREWEQSLQGQDGRNKAPGQGPPR